MLRKMPLASRQVFVASVRVGGLSFGGKRYLQTRAAPQIRNSGVHKGFDSVADVLVVGCGVAGCSAALRAAEAGLRVTVLSSATNPLDSNSYWAQGGIIYKGREDEDTPQMLEADVIHAGAGKCDHAAVANLAAHGARRVDELLLGGLGPRGSATVDFDRDPATGELSVCLEASHSAPRIIHWRDHTGKAITQDMVAAVAQHPNVTLRVGHAVADALVSEEDGRCVGMLALETDAASNSVTVHRIGAHATVLATGGFGALFNYSSNPASARGDGVAIASRLRASVANLEYVQFHPTTLWRPPGAADTPGEVDSTHDVPERPSSFLITEAVRGVGAKLRNPNTMRLFAKDYHPDGELAPRDVVARMIFSEMQKDGLDHVLLDASASGHDADWIRQRFPSIEAHCAARGLDFAATPGIPVVPAQHYACGGISVDLDGRTTVPGLFAAGETSCTGLHGANRLASTSLLEALVWGSSAAEALCDDVRAMGSKDLQEISYHRPQATPWKGMKPDSVLLSLAELNDRVRQVMSGRVGIVRTPSGLGRACVELQVCAAHAEVLHAKRPNDPAVVDVRNRITTALAIAHAAAGNPVSAGGHYIEADIVDEPHYDKLCEDHVGGKAPLPNTQAETEVNSKQLFK